MFFKMFLFLVVCSSLRLISLYCSKMMSIIIVVSFRHEQNEQVSCLFTLWHLAGGFVDGVSMFLPLILFLKYSFVSTNWYDPIAAWLGAALCSGVICSFVICPFVKYAIAKMRDRGVGLSGFERIWLVNQCGIVGLTIYLLNHTKNSGWMLLSFCGFAVCYVCYHCLLSVMFRSRG